ncbi:putative pilus biogenese protein [Azoarcus olearius]|uniref:hybrid sensor histidine kinase/response regulator n=1 Tax=Azoarcus sp. (strain BH72) TaxID=418699 RepID=UPI00080631FF|nr:Hpt domain-containing protein [Azoarcus olearius]ANQ86617.1 putative pilus biogenese protein [Azoarcus olearius]
MTHATEADLGPLTWVKSEIDAALGRAAAALDEAARADNDASRLAFAQTHLHQARGALSIVGLDGLTQFADGLGQLLGAMGRGECALGADTLALCKRALAALGNYLEELAHGVPDQPLRLARLYAELAAARGDTGASAADLFYPDLSVRPPRRSVEPAIGLDVQPQLRALRARFERGLLEWLKAPQNPGGAQAMREAVSGIEALQTSAPARALWWASIAFFDGLAAGSVPVDPTIKRQCTQLDAQMRRLMAGNTVVPDRLMRDLLYRIATMPATTEHQRAVKALWQLEALFPAPGTEISETPLAPLRQELRSRFAALRELWDEFSAGTAAALPRFDSGLTELRGPAHQLGHPAFDRLLAGMSSFAQWLRKDPLRFSDTVALEFATALLLADAALERGTTDGGFAAQVDNALARLSALARGETLSGADASAALDAARRNQEKEALGQLSREILGSLAHIEQALDDFFRDQSKRAPLQQLAAPLQQLEGLLSLLGEDEAIALVHEAGATIARFADETIETDPAEFQDLAHKLSALGFFVESLQRGRRSLQSFLAPESAAEQPAEIEAAPAVPETPRAAEAPVQAAGEAPPPAPEAPVTPAADVVEAPVVPVAPPIEPVVEAATKPVPAAEPAATAEAFEATTPEAVPIPPPPAETRKLIEEASEAEIDAELLGIFIEEAHEVLDTIGEHLELSRTAPTERDNLTAIRRGFHTLKGSGRMVGLRELGEAAWGLEQTLNRWLQLEWPPTPALHHLIDAGRNLFADWVRQLESGGPLGRDATALLAEAARLRESGEPVTEPAAAVSQPADAPSAPSIEEISLETALEFPDLALADNGEILPFEAPRETTPAFHAEDTLLDGRLDHLEDEIDVVTGTTLDFQALIAPDDAATEAPPPAVEVEELTLTAGFETPLTAEEAPSAPALEEPALEEPARDEAALEPPAAEPLLELDAEFSLDELLLPEPELTPLAGGVDELPGATALPPQDELLLPEPVALEAEPSPPEALLPEPAEVAAAAAIEEVELEDLALEIPDLDDATASALLPAFDATPAEAAAEADAGELADAGIIPPLAPPSPQEDEPAAAAGAAPAEPPALPDAGAELTDEAPPPPAPAPVYETAMPALNPADQVRIGDVDISRPLFDLYLAEARHHIGVLHGELARLAANPTLLPPETAVRAAHTLAGISGTARLSPLHVLARALEHALERLADLGQRPAEDEVALFGSVVDTLEAMLAEVTLRRMPLPVPEMVEQLEQIGRRVELSAQPETAPEPELPSLPPLAAEPPSAPPPVHDDVDAQLLPIFLEEAAELVSQLHATLRSWQADPAAAEPAKATARLLHTLKGSARMTGAMTLGEHVHLLESRLEATLKGGQDPAETLLEELANGVDHAEQMIDAIASGGRVEVPAAPAASAAGGPEAAETAAESEGAATSATLRVRADLVDRFVNEAGEIGIARTRIEGELRTLRRSLLDLTENVIRLRNQLREVEIQAEVQMQSRIAHAETRHASFDPLEMDRYTRLQELTRMMAESVNDVTTVQQNLLKNLDGADIALHGQARLSRELQQALMRVRMLPFDSLADRLYRVVRQGAKDLGKRANLDIRGGRIEVDRGVLEHMVAPLEHLLRNSLAHGIETPEARRAAGKPDLGQITLTVSQEGNEIAIELADDGAGLDFGRIAQRARESGLLGADEAPDERRLTNLIFVPGFSTAGAVSAVAGRGVGMDVVKAETAAVGGRIDVSSERGKGALFRIYLPLTLAVTQALLVRAGGRTYAIPSSMVAQVMELKPDALGRLITDGGSEWLGQRYDYSYLPRLLGDGVTQPVVQRYNWILLLRAGAQTLALHVDELRGNQEIVVKNAGPQLARIIGMSGATVLGDGEIVLILNPVALASRQLGHPDTAALPPGTAAAPAPARVPTVMVVDDSLTVRKITGRLLEREGYRVITAKDGVDALEKLIDTIPDVVLSDIEMPRMDGFDLVRNIRADARTHGVPVIMITSRLADKHRSYAQEVGANHYLGKPYQEEELLALIAGYTAAAAHA